MKNKQLILLACILQVTILFSQPIYYDVIKIKEANGIARDGKIIITPNNAGIILPILAKYANVESSYNNVEKEYNEFNNVDPNPFIEISGSAQFDNLKSKEIGSYSSTILGNIGGLDVTKYAEGMAIFMINRAKQELNVAFFQRFKDYLKKYPEVQTLFPETYRVTTNLLAYNYTNMINVLRSAYYQDLSQLIYNLEDVFLLPKYRKLTQEFPEILLSIRTIKVIASSVEDEMSPSEIIEKISQIEDWYKHKDKFYLSNVGNGFKLTNLISNSLIHDPYSNYQIKKSYISNDSLIEVIKDSLISTTINEDYVLKEYKVKTKYSKIYFNSITGEKDSLKSVDTTDIIRKIKLIRNDNNIWLTKSEFQAFLLDRNLFKIYLGLIYQKAKVDYQDKIIFKKNITDSITLTKFLEEKKDTIYIIENLFYDFYGKANLVNNSIKEIENKKDNDIELTKEDYTRYIYVSVDLIQFGIDIVWKIYPTLQKNPYLNLTNTSFDLYKNVYDQNYTSAVLDVVSISENVVNLVKASGEKAQNKTENVKDRDVKKEGDTLVEYFSLTNFGPIFQKLNSYGIFMANMVKAKNTEDVQAVIETAAMPVGGSSVKKYASFNVAVASYLGAYYNFSSDSTPQRSWDRRIGVSAPIGVNFSWGLKKAGSISIFPVLLDIGAIVDYKLNNDSTSIENKITFGNIFSPGGYVIYGFAWNLPIAVGFGGQYGPGLYKVNEDEVKVAGSTWSWRAFISVDIPLVTIYNRKKKKK